MTASEFMFLALGLVLGIAVGAALLQVVRSRPSAAREVRVTVAPDAVPRRRAVTLADDSFHAVAVEPRTERPAWDHRTPVRSGTAAAVRADDPVPGTIAEPAFRLAAPPTALRFAGSDAAPVTPTRTVAPTRAVPVSGGSDPMLRALRASAAASAERANANAAKAGAGAATSAGATTVGTRGSPVALRAARVAAPTIASGGGGPSGDPPRRAEAQASAAGPGDSDATLPTGPCAEPRRLADERCALAVRAREQAAAAEDALRTQQHAYDDHDTAAQRAAEAADARAIRQAKDAAQERFRAGRAGSTTTEEVEAAARVWLAEINTINTEARDSTLVLAREREAASAIGARLERLVVDSDAARIAAETAEAACLAAREALADCEESAAGELPGRRPSVPSGGEPVGGRSGNGDDDPLAAALGAGAAPRIFRLLRGDRSAVQEMVSVLADDGSDDRRRWQLLIADLVDAILADSIASSSLTFPENHPFWGPFSQAQSREIAAALSSLGFRFDGLGGWVDGRFPSQRDLSLALGYAGIDPMRLRQWPTEAETAELYRDVEVAAAERLAGAAGDLTLGELVSMLGRRADGLAEIWNHWGRIRPLLLED